MTPLHYIFVLQNIIKKYNITKQIVCVFFFHLIGPCFRAIGWDTEPRRLRLLVEEGIAKKNKKK